MRLHAEPYSVEVECWGADEPCSRNARGVLLMVVRVSMGKTRLSSHEF